ncbi:uncharacterized protein K441DRAFT_592582 [Cenococcum geophilum 1.58]|uniref:Uncharacterized protein n=1 Tax=Cenococcum geophilum 1.58 TaxID=794803 RepID=A0ACC8EMZ8_9PEZI|nr:hypothetical protein K441DRAFT_592582 [Cenococcum geophilum 1.58]
MSCCYTNDQSNPICERLFPPEGSFLKYGCLTGNCVNDCDPRKLYNSTLQQNGAGNGQMPILKYMACANIPSIASYANRDVLSPNITKSIQKFIFPHTTEDSLQNVTSAVTDCLSSTCRRSRDSTFCYTNYCSPVKLLRNNTSPNLEAIHTCLNTLCDKTVKALPWADTDVIGIGVFSSYVMQCIFIVILWLGFLGFAIYQHKRSEPERPSEPGKHYKSWINLLSEFHKSQCFFSATLMIASLNYGIYKVDTLVTFLLTPLATNSVLPVVFAYLLLLYYRKSSTGVTLLTISVYALSTLVYWSLYWHFIPLGDSVDAFNLYRNFRFRLSALPACGGYSGLSVCPNEYARKGLFNARDASRRIKFLTPLIWTYSTLILFALLAYQLYRWRSKRGPNMDSPVWHRAFWFTTIIFLAAIGMQLDVLSISIKLNMINPGGWTFGQIVAVTVWIPPLLDYVYREMSEWLRRRPGC